jgi:hypothetical protein
VDPGLPPVAGAFAGQVWTNWLTSLAMPTSRSRALAPAVAYEWSSRRLGQVGLQRHRSGQAVIRSDRSSSRVVFPGAFFPVTCTTLPPRVSRNRTCSGLPVLVDADGERGRGGWQGVSWRTGMPGGFPGGARMHDRAGARVFAADGYPQADSLVE